MRNLSTSVAVVVAAIGFAAFSAGTASAAGCLDPNALTPMTLTHDATVPGAGFRYDKDAYDAQLAKGNRCSPTQQSLSVGNDRVPVVRGAGGSRARMNDRYGM